MFDRLMTVCGLATILSVSQAAFCAQTTVSVEITKADQPTGKSQSADNSSTMTVLLVGDPVSSLQTGKKAEHSDTQAETKQVLGGNIIDKTTTGALVGELASKAADYKQQHPKIVIVFAGLADEKAKTPDDAQQQSLTLLINALAHDGTRVYLVPSSTQLSAGTNANLRLAASQSNGTYIDLGTEIGGHPLQEALNSIHADLNRAGSKQPIDIIMTPVPAPESAILQAPVPSANPAGTQPAQTYTEQRASLSNELSHIAGEVDSAPSAGTSEPLDGFSAPQKTLVEVGDSASSVSQDGSQVVKRGAAAQETINMRPLPPVKAFRPQLPVPRNEINKKEPALSRQ